MFTPTPIAQKQVLKSKKNTRVNLWFSNCKRNSGQLVWGFTLIEISVIILSIALILSITFRLFSFKRDFWLLREKSFQLTKDLNRVRDLAFQGLSVGADKICGSGLLLDKRSSRNHYVGVAYVASGGNKDCATIASGNYNLTGSADPETDANIYKITRFFNFTTAASDLLKEKLEGVAIEAQCSGVCANSANLSNFDTLQLLFKNPYAEPLVFYSQAGNNWEIADWDEISLAVKYKQEPAVSITLTRTGQIRFK